MDPLTIVMLAVLALLIFFMFRNSRKRQRDLAEMAERTVPGAEVMTSFGVFGTILSVDDEENRVQIETSPGTVLTVHRQTIAKVVEPHEVVTDDEAEAIEEGEVDPGTPTEATYGERTTDAVDDTNPATRARKKIDE
ncbi:preprotein translocase subunit YajC [Naasia sp. SYSU D00948]|uniref:preprotein translocase subunit YajC n=1 Tax=Naasia sp. SYSU D00948 TaxID=2817379 RepID=UPI0027DAFA8B|nr:preprotein translocase subunit YajC [Naasia sp. SYSU D00948]